MKKTQLKTILSGCIITAMTLASCGGQSQATDQKQDNNTQKQEQPQKPDTKSQDTPAAGDQTADSPTEQEKKKNEENSALKEEYETLLADAKKVLDTKNVARALPLYQAIAGKTPAYAEAQETAKEKIQFCKDQIAKTPLYSLKKEITNGKIGYLNKEGYTVIDYIYKDEIRHDKKGKLLALKNETGKWAIIDDDTKLPITDFKYTDTGNRHDFAGEYKMYIAGDQKRFDIIKPTTIEEYTDGKKTNTIKITSASQD